MPVTDLTDSLPWWTRGGAPAPQGPGPTGGPAATPQGADPSQPPPGVDPAQWLQYLTQIFGVGSAQAGTQDINAALNKGGSPVPSALGSGGPPVPPSVASLQPTPPQPTGGPEAAADAATAPRGGAYSHMPFPGQRDPQGFYAPTPGAPMPPQASAAVGAPAAPAPPVAGPLAAGGAGGQGSTSNPRFVQVDRPNASAAGGFGRGGGPQMTALNLAGLFGGGQPNPADMPTRNATPVSGPLAKGRAYPGNDWDIDAQGNVVPSYGTTTSNAPWNYGPRQNPAVTARMRNPRNYG